MGPAFFAFLVPACVDPPTETDPVCRTPTGPAWSDADGDGYGDPASEVAEACGDLEGRVDNADDCDDTEASVHPGADEACNERDDDCDGIIDEETYQRRYFADNDGDGFGVPEPTQRACLHPGDGWSINTLDCDDTDPDIHPDATEVCNAGVDDDCDQLADDDDDSLDLATRTTLYADLDADGFGDPEVSVTACAANPDFAADATDCDPADGSIFPGQTEIPADGIDQDCDSFDDCYLDADDDGYGTPTVIAGQSLSCTSPGEATNVDDCDDGDFFANVEQPWYPDLDGDGYGSGSPVLVQCLHPGNGLGIGLDCDDTDDLTYPGAPDLAGDGLDTSCSGFDGDGFVDDFEWTGPGELWIDLTGDWGISQTYAVSGAQSLRLGGGGATVETIPLNMGNCNFVEYAFEAKRGPETPDLGDNLTFSYWNQSTWTPFHQVAGAGVTDNNFSSFAGIISNLDAFHGAFQVRVVSNGSGNGFDDFFIDDLRILCGI